MEVKIWSAEATNGRHRFSAALCVGGIGEAVALLFYFLEGQRLRCLAEERPFVRLVWTRTVQRAGPTFSISSPRVKLLVDGFEALGVNVGVDLSGGNIGVAEHFLNHAQRCSVVE